MTSLWSFERDMIQIHQPKSDHHVRWGGVNGEHQHVDHIYYMTHARPFGPPCSEAMSVHARLVKSNPSVLHVQNWLAPVVCERRVYHTRSSRGASKRRTLLTVHTKEEHIIILILSGRDHLILLPHRSYLRKIRWIKRINITCMDNVIWYGSSRTWSPSCASWYDLHHSTGVAPRSIVPPSWLSIKITTYHMDMIYSTQAIKFKMTTIRLLPVCHNLQRRSSHTSSL